MATTTLWQHTPSGDTALVVMDLQHAHGDLGDDVTRIEVATDDPRWITAVTGEAEKLAERNSETGAVFIAASYESPAEREYDDHGVLSANLRPHGVDESPDPDGFVWVESVRQVRCDSDEWSAAVTNELSALRYDGLVAA